MERFRTSLKQKPACEVAIIGAGPYGLSLAAHLTAKGIDCRIFGKPPSTWSAHMPKGMLAKSEGFESNLSAPSPEATFESFCAARGIRCAAQDLSVALETFRDYAEWFRRRLVPQLEEVNVESLTYRDGAYRLVLEDRRCVAARKVVLATDLTWFSDLPSPLAELPPHLVSHSFDHCDGEGFRGRDVVVVGAGSTAADMARLLQEASASVRIVARAPSVKDNSVPAPDAESLLQRIPQPASGSGWRSYVRATAPLLFRRRPDNTELRAVRSHTRPAAGWFMRKKIDGLIPLLPGRAITDAKAADGRVLLSLRNNSGQFEPLVCDHVIAAMGYKPDMRNLPFLSRELCDQIAPNQPTAPLNDKFETRAPGLFVIGPAAIDSFGPHKRFMHGAASAALHVAGYLERRMFAQTIRRAA